MNFSGKFFRLTLAVALMLYCISGISALEVSETELESVKDPGIVFINYTGPHTVIDSMNDIRGIGTNMGQIINSGGKTAGYGDRYQIIHAVDGTVLEGLDADIFIIGAGAGVDHINNLRAIIASYLVSAYGYNRTDASTLASFITVYNAVYRGNITPLQSKYKKIVLNNLKPDAAGLAVSYTEWPGKSQIVIPLSNRPGTLSTIDTTIISDKTVVESMRDDADKNVGNRRDMVNLKEREAAESQQRAEAAQKEATDAQKQTAAEQARLAQEDANLKQKLTEAEAARKEAEAARLAAENAQKKAAENPADVQAQEAAKEKEIDAVRTEQNAEQKQAAADAQEQKTAEQQTAVEQAVQQTEILKRQAAEEQAFADKKQAEAMGERTEIAKDQQQVIAEQAAAEKKASGQNEYAIKITDTANLLSGIVLVDLDTGKTIKQSPVNSIRGRTILPNGNDFIAVAGKNTGNGAIRLVLINGETLDIVSQNNEDVAEQAVPILSDGFYYTIIKSGKDWVIGKYNGKLELQGKSSLKVIPETAITVTSKGLLVQAADNTIHLITSADLIEVAAK